jgi:hypothetical protein
MVDQISSVRPQRERTVVLAAQANGAREQLRIERGVVSDEENEVP